MNDIEEIRLILSRLFAKLIVKGVLTEKEAMDIMEVKNEDN